MSILALNGLIRKLSRYLVAARRYLSDQLGIQAYAFNSFILGFKLLLLSTCFLYSFAKHALESTQYLLLITAFKNLLEFCNFFALFAARKKFFIVYFKLYSFICTVVKFKSTKFITTHWLLTYLLVTDQLLNLKRLFASFTLYHILVKNSDYYRTWIPKALYSLAYFATFHFCSLKTKSAKETTTLWVATFEGIVDYFYENELKKRLTFANSTDVVVVEMFDRRRN